MILEYKNYYKCPNCEQILYKDMMDNLNCNSEVVRYSDDKIVGIGFNGMFSFTRCSNCNSIIALNDETLIKEIVKDNEAIEASYPNLDDCLKTLNELAEGDTHGIENTEFVVRKHLIWVFNDRVRQGLPVFEDQEDFDIWYDNALKILNNSNFSHEREIFLKVEIYRYLGKFEEAEKTLSSIKTSDPFSQSDIDEVREHIEEKNRELFISKYKF